MKKFYLYFLTVLSLFVLYSFNAYSQQGSCTTNVVTIDTAIACSQTCVSLQVNIPDVRQSTDYTVVSLPYLPYPYQCPSDTALTTLNIDDKFSPVVNLPFNFCFYGVSYNKMVVGSNGLITFDIANANCSNAYTIQPGQTIPRANGTQCGSISTSYYPRACVMGAYYDIDPNASGANFIGRRISYYFTGVAPNRKVVIVFYHVPLFSCTSSIADQEIVLYETTGIIDVHIGNKPSCTTWNNGLAILGIQNWDRNQGVAAPGKNCTQWTASNETYRFTPSGAGASLFKKAYIYRGNTLLDTATVSSSTTAGLLTATFPSTCFTTDTASFRAVAYYTSCANPTDSVSYETIINVQHNGNLPVTAAAIPASCGSGGNGTITVSNPVGANYEYSIDSGLTYQSSPTFITPSGSYTVIARNTQCGCVGSATVNIPIIETVKFNTSVFNATCYGATNGQVLVATQSGASPFQFSADSGITYQGSNLLLMGAGRHVIMVKDNNGCTKDTVVIVGQPDSLSIATQVAAAFCSGDPDGQIKVTTTGGTPTYKYALTNTPAAYQNNDTLMAKVGSYTVYVKDNNNCVDSVVNIVVPLNDTMRLAHITDTTLCIGSSLTIVPNTNATQFSWSPNIAISDTSAALPIIAPQDTLMYHLVAKLGQLCTRTDSFTVNVLKRPIINAGPDTTICFGTKAYFHAESIRGKDYRWSPSVNLNSYAVSNPVATGYTPMTYIVQVSDPYGCGFKEYDTLNLTVRPKVRAFAGQDTTATLGQGVQLTGCCMDIYQWQPSSIFVNDTARNPIGHFPAGNTQVVMITTTPEGCQGTDTVLVKGYIGPTYYVPSAFTPNGDGRNDVFRPVPVGITETYYFNVYNRYGQMVYTTKTFMEGWDGKWKGQVQPDAAYVWMVKGKGIDGKTVEMKGTVVLMK